MNLKIRRIFFGLVSALYLVGTFSTSYSCVISVSSCVTNLKNRCIGSRGIFLNYGTTPMSRAAVLEATIDRIGKVFSDRERRGLGSEVDCALEKELMASFPEVEYELSVCLHYSKKFENILESLKNMRYAYRRIYLAYRTYNGHRRGSL